MGPRLLSAAFLLVGTVGMAAALAIAAFERAPAHAEKPAICAGLNAHDCIARLQGEPI